ncbi:MAG TPA: hypothetical protein VL137_12015 [Polyangiaceae bacterium]|nr:hypothetical protein [Polyangiaceae bacterium]
MLQTKGSQLQVRVSLREKKEIQRRARAAGASVSAWVLRQLLPDVAQGFQDLVKELHRETTDPSYALAALGDFLTKLPANDFPLAVAEGPVVALSPFSHAYLSALVEHCAAVKHVAVPHWVLKSEALSIPYFASELRSLRLYLLTHSPPAFRRRNLFVDASATERI